MSTETKIFKLDSKSISDIIDITVEYLERFHSDSKEILRLRLTMEEVLLSYKEKLGEEQTCKIRLSIMMKTAEIRLYVAGSECNPFRTDDDDYEIMSSLIAGYATERPTWKYKNLKNEITFRIKKKGKSTLLTRILLAVVLGSLLGFLARFLPNDLGRRLAEDIVTPLTNSYAGLICVMAVVITFCAVTLGIVRAGDISTISKIAKRMIGRFFIISGAILLLYSCVVILFIDIVKKADQKLEFLSIYDIILQFIPNNIVTPFINFNSAQLIIISTMFGLAMIVLGNKVEHLTEVMNECNIVAITVNSFLNDSLVSIYVGLSLFVIAVTATNEVVVSSLRIFGSVLAVYLMIVIGYTVYFCIYFKCAPGVWLKKAASTFIVNLTSASFGASFQTNVEMLIAQGGMDPDYASLGLNIGSVVFKPAYCVLYIVMSISFAKEYNMPISLNWIVCAVILSWILALSLPSIRGAALSGFALLFSQLGFPSEAMALAITINAIVDFFTVAINVFCLQTELEISGYQLKRVDKATLLK